jgi:DNA-binding PadR family transcriptional regulator
MPKNSSASTSPGGRPNDPTVLILTSLAAEPKHGYALLRDIEEFGGVRLGPGTLYGAISRLEERGLIEAAGAEGRRRPYRITPAGRESLSEAIASMRLIVEAGTERLAGAAPTGPLAAGGTA